MTFLLLFFVSIFLPTSIHSSVVSNTSAIATGAQRRLPQKTPRLPAKPRIDYTQFSHGTHVNTQKLACASCHKFPTKNWKDVRKGDAAFPDVAEFPEHSACLDCHREQIFARERPAPAICANCHVAVTPRDQTRFQFPSLGDVADLSRPHKDFVSEFAVNFPHEMHLDVVSRNPPQSKPDTEPRFVAVSWSQEKVKEAGNCAVCHQTYQPQGNSSDEYVTKPPKDLGDRFWLKKGTFKSSPNSHAICFTCHNADSGIAPASSDCQTCHRLLSLGTEMKRDFDPKLIKTIGIDDSIILAAWRKRISAGGFRHEGGVHPDLNCTNCHQPSKLSTIDERAVKVPVQSCGGAEGCHITATADEGGILNYELDHKKSDPGFQCTKCHVTFGKNSPPASHVEAIPKSSKK